MSTNSDNQPWAWLGLLKWSLSYADGTNSSDTPPAPMSDEKRAFLEAVMKDGIINEGERLRDILTDLTTALQSRRDGSHVSSCDTVGADMEELLEELRDIVEQIDYARGFVGMGGIPFLLGCAGERDAVPVGVRSASLVVLATLAQNNPPVQSVLLTEHDALTTLTSLYEAEEGGVGNEVDGFRGRVVQALSCTVRGIDAAEEAFSRNRKCVGVIESGLGVGGGSSPPDVIKKRSLFLLRALVCADGSTAARLSRYQSCIQKIIDFVDVSKETNLDIRETSLQLLLQILQQKKRVNDILDCKDLIAGTGVSRVATIRKLPPGDEKELLQVELELWESLIVELARGQRDEQREVENLSSERPLMLMGRPENDSGETLPQ